MSTTTGSHHAIDCAAAHVSAAAELLDTSDTSEELFSPAHVLAVQLALIAAALSVDAPAALASSAPDAADPIEHVNQALLHLDGAIGADSAPELLVWMARLRDLQPKLRALTTRP